MKIDAYIRWTIDNKKLGIEHDKVETVLVDADYVNADYEDIVEWIENELYKKYKTVFHVCRNSDDGDFELVNPNEVNDNLRMDDFNDKTELTINGPQA